MKTQTKLPIMPWYEYLESLTKEGADNAWLPPKLDMLQRLRDWQNRFVVYSEMKDESFNDFKAWKKKNKLTREGEKLQKALLAIEELYKENITDENYVEMQNAAYNIANIQLIKLEMTQLRMLSKAQNLNRKLKDGASLADKKKKLDEIRIESRKVIEGKPKGERFSRTASHHKLDNTSTFFKAHERKIHFTKHFRRADKTSDTMNVFSAINSLLSHIGALSTTLMNAMSVLGSILLAVPFVNAIGSAIAIIIHAAKMWLQNKSLTKQVFAGVLIGVVAGGFITMGLGTIAAAGVAVGLMTIGTYVKHIYPWEKCLRQIRNKKNELAELETIDLNALSFTIGPRERQFLMVKAEEAFINQKINININQLREIQNFIMNEKNKFPDLASNPDIKALLPVGKDLKQFLVDQMTKRKEDLESEIKELSKFEKRKRWNVISGVIAISGAILLCIPTPVTMIIGASLLMTSAVIGVSLAYSLGTKITNLVNRVFGRKTAEAPPTSDKPTPTPTHSPTHNLQSTAEVSQDLHIDLSKQSQPANEPSQIQGTTSVPQVPPTQPPSKKEDQDEGKHLDEHPTNTH